MPIVEANKVGRIVVTSNISSMPEIAGSAAIFVDPLSVASINSGIQEAILKLNEPSELIEAGKQNAERFDLINVSDAYAKLYYKIAGRKNKVQ
jgi:glycosyltransferase involved in cell wall biosynthesis